MDIKLIAIDIDGTLLNEKNELAQATIDAIKAAAAKGIKVALCSGRPLSGIRPYLKPLGIEGDEQYAIAFNGSVTETVSGKLISKMGINYEDFLQIEMMSREMGVHFQIETLKEIIVTNRNISPYSTFEAGLVRLPIHFRTPEEITREDDIIKMMYTDEEDKIQYAMDNLPNSIKQRMQVVRSMPFFLEFVNSHAGKGTALKNLAEKLGLTADNVMAIGDQGNDHSMIEYAGLGVAMGNGIKENKDIAQFVTKTNSEDGVAFALNKFINK
ncbi:sugar-phosphatase [Fructilactobacillus sanfranciscensis]|uniref:sugar-phosphatase n=1 Tax=Fructilactobacillus sanfranciscensis TaxID=1625 RepID=UPI0011191D42|nr:sugar-phosphatase [Fructilactobacillus sanfranciscensis]NDR60123.1 sugar-phosphatase [Fructilactobacillus sanfranciscensis]TNK97479.1 sugar-phosphatase [Fructilactobacillus sanfranciscensis]WED57768.1 sugar-phosphatase [Fructilactobacillus sanfranciscensis]